MAGLNRGLEFMAEQAELQRERQEQRKAEDEAKKFKINKLWLKEDEFALIYFITDGEDMLFPYTHTKKIEYKRNNETKSFNKDVLCGKEITDDDGTPGSCEYCEQDPPAPGPWPKACSLVFVHQIYHTQKSTNPEKIWEQKKSGGRIVYLEEVNETWLLISKGKLGPQIIEAYKGTILEPKKNQTLLDCAYILTRTGSGAQTTETLKPSSTLREIPPFVIKARKEAPTLESVVLSEFKEIKFPPSTKNKTNVVIPSAVEDLEDIDLLNYTPPELDDEVISFD